METSEVKNLNELRAFLDSTKSRTPMDIWGAATWTRVRDICLQTTAELSGIGMVTGKEVGGGSGLVNLRELAELHNVEILRGWLERANAQGGEIMKGSLEANQISLWCGKLAEQLQKWLDRESRLGRIKSEGIGKQL